MSVMEARVEGAELKAFEPGQFMPVPRSPAGGGQLIFA